MNMNQQYNKTISFKPMEICLEEPFDLCKLTYNGHLTKIVDYFNKRSIEECIKIVRDSKDPETNRNALQIASFLNFSNIFLYLLTYNADPYYCDQNNQSTWHMICYKGNIKLLTLLLNNERYKLKIKSLENVDDKKKHFGFSNLDIVKGKLSRAVHLSESNITKFNNLQMKLKEEGRRLIEEYNQKLTDALQQKDKNGQNPLHLGAMSKFPLSHMACNKICDFDFFKLDEDWDEYLTLHEGLRALEIKPERTKDPRRTLRLERELLVLLGDNIIKEYFSPMYAKSKKEMLKKVINAPDKDGDSVLHISAFHGDFRIVNKFVKFGGDKKMENNTGKMPVDLAKDNFVRKVLTNLNKAAKTADDKNIKELVNFGNDINEKLSIFSQAPIHKIVESTEKDKETNKYQVLQQMLDMGADPKIKDSNGWSALHYACQLGDFESVKILVAGNAEVDSYSNNKRTPLHLAANMNFPVIVNYLLENRADPNYKDHLGCTPMHLAAKQGNTECITYLLENNGDLYCEDFRGWNILHYAAFHGHQKTVRYISKYDADYDILRTSRNSQNKLPIEIVRDPKVKPFFTSLWHAAKEGSLDITRMLINEGEKVDELTHFEQNSPLHLAVMNHHYLLVRLLVENKCNINLANKEGLLASEYASLAFGQIQRLYESSEDKTRDTKDLREIIRCMSGKPNKIIDATIAKDNWNVKIWKLYDFNMKIQKILPLDKEQNNANEVKEEKGINEEIKNE